MGINEGGAGTDEGDVGMRENLVNTLTELSDDLGHALASHSEGGGMNVGLGGYAAHVETRSSHIGSLKDDDLQPLPGGIFCGAVASRACTDDDQISCCH